MNKDDPAQASASTGKGGVRQPLPPNLDPLLRERARADFTGFSRSAWHAKMRAGEAPLPVRIGKRAVAWRASDLQKWADSLAQKGAAQ